MPRKPKSAGQSLRERIIPTYSLRPDELTVLESACAVADVIAELEAAWSADGRPMTTKGSMGQLVIHPLIGEIRTQRSTLARLLAQLKLPDLDDEAPATNQNRDAANASWQPGVRGRGAS